jgi:hypothetical protein
MDGVKVSNDTSSKIGLYHVVKIITFKGKNIKNDRESLYPK